MRNMGITMTAALPLWFLVMGTLTPAFPKCPCDIYAAEGTPCVAAHSTVRALYPSYNGPLYQVRRMSDLQTKDIGVLTPGGFVNAAVQDSFLKAHPRHHLDNLRSVSERQPPDVTGLQGGWIPGRDGSESNATDATIKSMAIRSTESLQTPTPMRRIFPCRRRLSKCQA